MTSTSVAISLRDASARLGFSVKTGRRRIAEGTFPVPALPRHGKSWWKFSTADIDRYLNSAATDDARKGAA